MFFFYMHAMASTQAGVDLGTVAPTLLETLLAIARPWQGTLARHPEPTCSANCDVNENIHNVMK